MDYSLLTSFCDKEQAEYYINAKTAPLTTINVGNRADLVIYPPNMQFFCRLLDLIVANKFKFVVIGRGSNCYFCDNYEGIVIVTRYLNDISLNNNKITAMCGATITSVARYALLHLLCGLEFAYGIPGSIGGAVYMNAEAYERSFQSVIESSLVYDIKDMTVKEISNKEHCFNTKQSIFSIKKNYIHLQSVLNLSTDIYENIYERMINNLQKRVEKQPLDVPSAGSAFKRPNCNKPASMLIDEARLKGVKFGGAEVSKKHAGFIVNSGNATAADINNLLKHIKTEIYKKFKVNLYEEIIYLE